MIMSVEQALSWLQDGSAFLDVDVAENICDALGATLDDSTITRWHNGEQAVMMGITAKESPGQGVWVLSLSADICRQLKVEYNRYRGIALQAREQRQALCKHFDVSQHGDKR